MERGGQATCRRYAILQSGWHVRHYILWWASKRSFTRYRRFSWVVCQVDRLRHTFPISIRKVLNDLPKTLDETYDRTLLNIDEEKREFAQRLFRCLAVSIRPLRVDELGEILAIQFDEVAIPTFNAAWRPENAEEAVISACSSLITIVDKGGRQVVQFSHFSVKEYLTSERLSA